MTAAEPEGNVHPCATPRRLEAGLPEKIEQVSKPLKPLLKWAGGKRWLLPEITHRIGGTPNRLIEPFCGGAAVFFGLQPQSAVLGDANPNLIEAYQAVRDEPERVLVALAQWTNSEEEYYRVRSLQPASRAERAARFYYLCRHSFNGIYRVNRAGQFNVPYNHKVWREVVDEAAIREASIALSRARLVGGDFEASIEDAKAGDVVYCDPPYTVAHNNNGFIKYNEKIFSFADQERLAKAARDAACRGARVFISNADHPSVRELYSDAEISTIERHSIIGSRAEYRKIVTELLIEI